MIDWIIACISPMINKMSYVFDPSTNKHPSVSLCWQKLNYYKLNLGEKPQTLHWLQHRCILFNCRWKSSSRIKIYRKCLNHSRAQWKYCLSGLNYCFINTTPLLPWMLGMWLSLRTCDLDCLEKNYYIRNGRKRLLCLSYVRQVWSKNIRK